jgi:hypothetical protein
VVHSQNPRTDTSAVYVAHVSKNLKSFVRAAGVIALLLPALSVLPIGLATANAESYTIELGETFYYDSCWTRVGSPARLERKVPGKSIWKQVARAKPVRSSDCDSGYKLVSYKWKPKTLGKHRLRESLPNAYGSKRTYSKAFSLSVVEPTIATLPPTIATLPPTIATLPPSLGTGGGVSSSSVSLTSSWSDLFQRYSISGSAGGSSVSLTSSWSDLFQRYSISGSAGGSSVSLTSSWSDLFQRYSISGSAGGSSVSLTSSWSDLFQRYSISGTGPAVISAIIAAISVQIR